MNNLTYASIIWLIMDKKMKLNRQILSFVLLLTPLTANSLTFGEPLKNGDWFKELELKTVEITIHDDVKDGCWTNIRQVREYTEEKLRMIGVEAVDKIKTPSEVPDLRLAIVEMEPDYMVVV